MIPLWDDYEVDPESVGQFIGLCDKNGKEEIYEGDICRFMRKDFITRFGEDSLGFELKFIERTPEEAYKYDDILFGVDIRMCYDRIEIIGNAYENPELMK